MIRRDYFIKLVQELSSVLMRVFSLKARREFAAALEEIDLALEKYLHLAPDEAIPEKLDHLLRLCGREEGPVNEKVILLADVFYQQGELLTLRKGSGAARRPFLLALGLYLESARHGFVSLDLIKKTDTLVERMSDAPLPVPILRRLFAYLEDRALYATAENALYEWLDQDSTAAAPEGLAFYDRLLKKIDADLERGGLPRAEVEEGRNKLLNHARGSS
jgi:hypothetical protein